MIEPTEKRVYLIRHGHSRYNDWRDRSWLPWAGCTGLCIGDPLIADAALSAKGEGQLAALRQRVQQLGLDESVELVVTSPLTRAITTTLGGFDTAALRRRGVPIVVSALHAEICDTACDVGRPLSVLRKVFGELAWSSSVGRDGAPLCAPEEPEPPMPVT